MKWMLKTYCTYSGTETYHEIDGDWETEEKALEAYGGHDAAWQQAIEDTDPGYCIEEYDEDLF